MNIWGRLLEDSQLLVGRVCCADSFDSDQDVAGGRLLSFPVGGVGHLHDLGVPFRQMGDGLRELFLCLLSTALGQNDVAY